MTNVCHKTKQYICNLVRHVQTPDQFLSQKSWLMRVKVILTSIHKTINACARIFGRYIKWLNEWNWNFFALAFPEKNKLLSHFPSDSPLINFFKKEFSPFPHLKSRGIHRQQIIVFSFVPMKTKMIAHINNVLYNEIWVVKE